MVTIRFLLGIQIFSLPHAHVMLINLPLNSKDGLVFSPLLAQFTRETRARRVMPARNDGKALISKRDGRERVSKVGTNVNFGKKELERNSNKSKVESTYLYMNFEQKGAAYTPVFTVLFQPQS